MIAPKQAKRGVTINAEAGKTCVVKYGTPIHIFDARPKLKLMTLEEAQKNKRFAKRHHMKMQERFESFTVLYNYWKV